MKYFVSHSSKDKLAIEKLVSIIKQNELTLDKNRDIFCSSIPQNGSDFKENLITNINNHITQAENIILVITDHYLRSSYCFYEMSIARYLQASGRKIILIVQNESVAQRIDDIFPSKTFLHINAMLGNAASTLVKNLGYEEEMREAFQNFFHALCNAETVIGTPYIGMLRKDYEQKYEFVEKYGIKKISFDYPATPDIAKKELANAEEIYFVSTTGSGFLKTYKEILSTGVANGCNLSLIISDKNSLFGSDVADIEAFAANADYKQLKENNETRITSEFQATFQYLNEIFVAANKSGTAGKIYCASCYTLIRQTALIAKKRNGDYWGWITCTMPPVRSADQTMSILFEGNSKNILVNDVWKYSTTLFDLAKHRGGVIEVDGIHFPEKLDLKAGHEDFEGMLKDKEAYWEERYRVARNYMAQREDMFSGVLIEVAAQHPLKKLKEPNKEFEARLNKAIELYHKYVELEYEVMIYVPGSRHQFDGIADKVSLSEAGTQYLLDKGIPAECLLGDKENKRYKGVHGVYNSADECFVASEIFKKGPFEKLICVCSPNQIMRKTMLYIEFGCVPLCYGVTVESMYHKNVVEEIFQSLNRVLYVDHSWQDETSEWFQYFRNTRRPAEE